MKRRDFLKQSAGTAVGATALAAGAPALLRADDHPSRKNPIIGHGEYRYECLHNWGQLPSNLTWQTTHGVTIDADGLIYIKHQGYGDTPLDTIVVHGSHYIHQYDKNANWVRTWGGFGTEPGKFNTPHGLWWDDRPGRTPSLVIADRANARLQYFTQDGQPIGMVHDVLFPAHFDIRGDVLLVPDLYARVSLFDRGNKAIIHLGDDPAWTAEVKKMQIRNDPSKWIPGKFVHPHDACFDKDGNIFVTEWVQSGRVTKLRRLG